MTTFGNTNLFTFFDYDKAKVFYIDWLGFTIDWENKPLNSPIYLQISLDGIVIHLTEHHDDFSPGARNSHCELQVSCSLSRKNSIQKLQIKKTQFRKS